MIFKKPTNPLEGQPKPKLEREQIVTPVICPKCKKSLDPEELQETLKICPYCRYHFKLNPRRRLNMLCDPDTFRELDASLRGGNVLDFPGYDDKLRNAALESREPEAVVCGTAEVGGIPAALFVMNPFFMMGSMGSAVGEKITRLFEYAADHSLPVVGFTVSGGARMQEGILSLMQMAKCSGAVKRHSDRGLFYLCVLTDPTTGGVTASFAMEADVILAEPFALVAFAGPRVIEQTIHRKLPEGFQSAEFLLEKGFADGVIDRRSQKKVVSSLLRLHCGGVRV